MDADAGAALMTGSAGGRNVAASCSTGVRNTRLDGLRGWAALMVVIYHSVLERDGALIERVQRPPFTEMTSAHDVWAKLVLMITSGETAVVIFFVLSGAVLFESLRRMDGSMARITVAFSVRRLFRLYPAFFVFLVACLGVFTYVGFRDWPAKSFWPNAALIDFPLLGASWTLQVEFFAIPFVLLAYASFRRFGMRGALAVGGLIVALRLGPPWGEALVACRRFLPCFALGILIPTRAGAIVARLTPNRAWLPLLVATLAVRHVFPINGLTMTLAQLLAGVLVNLLWHRDGGGFGRFLQSPISEYLGRLSYSVYLSHTLFLVLASHVVYGVAAVSRQPLLWGLALSLPICGATIVTSHFAEKYLEQPSIRLGRALSQRLLAHANRSGAR